MVVSIDEYNVYTGNYEDSDDAKALKIFLLEAAQETVESYLRYSLEGIDEDLESQVTAIWGQATIPQAIKLMIMRIATLMLTETNMNIGITGRVLADQSRTFISNTNYNKYLIQIAAYRMPKF